MGNINRDDIQIISRHSNVSSEAIDKLLKEQVYNDAESWQKFLRLLFISLGIGFSVTGILFFFAYNWADLHKFAKIGLIEIFIIALTLIAVFSNIKPDIRNILITGASMVVGVLFAVFGQIYQTGANAYDFFFGWTMAITLWVLISNFAPLWLIYITLINTTFVLYTQQIAHGWSNLFIVTLLFIVNILFLVFFLFGSKVTDKIHAPNWFTNLLALAAVCLSTMGVVAGIFDKKESSGFLLLSVLTIVVYGLGLKYGLDKRRSFYLSIIPFSAIIIISALFVKVSNGGDMFLFISLFVVGSVTIVVKTLMSLQKKWINE